MNGKEDGKRDGPLGEALDHERCDEERIDGDAGGDHRPSAKGGDAGGGVRLLNDDIRGRGSHGEAGDRGKQDAVVLEGKGWHGGVGA